MSNPRPTAPVVRPPRGLRKLRAAVGFLKSRFGSRPASASLRHVLTLLTSTRLAQLIALAASPLLSRLYTPENFGVFALYLSAVTLLAILATGRYELAIVLPEDDDDARHLFALALFVSLVVTAATLLAVLLWGDGLAARAGHAELSHWLYLLPLSVGLTALVNTLSCWANRQKQYPQLALSRVVQTGASAAVNVGLGLGGWATSGLLLGSTLAQAVAAAMLAVPTRGALRAPLRLERVRLRRLMRRYINFPRVNLPHALLDALQASALLGLMGAAFGSQVLGGYAFALRIARIPLAMLGASVGQVFQQRAAQIFNEGGDLAALARRTTLRLAWFALPFVALMLAAPALFGWAFGPIWREAGVYALILTPWMVLNFLSSPLSQLPLVVGRQGQALAFGVAYQVSMLAPYALAWALGWGVHAALGVQSAASSVVLFGYGLWLHRLAGTVRAA